MLNYSLLTAMLLLEGWTQNALAAPVIYKTGYVETGNGYAVEAGTVQVSQAELGVSYEGGKFLLYDCMTLKYPSGATEIFYQTPSVPTNDPLGVLPTLQLSAMADKSRIEIVSDRRSSFEFFRFTKTEGKWKLLGIQEFNDRNSSTLGVHKGLAAKVTEWETGAKLVDWNTVRIFMSNGSERTFVVGEDGVFMENGTNYVYVMSDNVKLRSYGFSDSVTYARWYYQHGTDQYHLPRDKHGVILPPKLPSKDISEMPNIDGINAKMDLPPPLMNAKPSDRKRAAPVGARLAFAVIVGSAIGLILLLLKQRGFGNRKR